MARRIDFVSIVVPTYNERENLPRLLSSIDRHLSRDYEVVVVDDGSPDGTADLARELSDRYPVRILEREQKMGLGNAYRAGFEAARGDVIFEMDADLSHDPRYLPALIEAVQSGAGMALGSRYIDRGNVRGWGAYRRLVSAVGNTLARGILGLPVRDATSGFRCYAAEHADLVTMSHSDGYAFQVEVLYLLKRRGVDVAEVPIVFENRANGKSKLGPGEFAKFLKTLGALRLGGSSVPPAARKEPRSPVS